MTEYKDKIIFRGADDIGLESARWPTRSVSACRDMTLNALLCLFSIKLETLSHLVRGGVF